MPFNLLGFASGNWYITRRVRPGAKGCDVIELIRGVAYRTHSRISFQVLATALQYDRAIGWPIKCENCEVDFGYSTHKQTIELAAV